MTDKDIVKRLDKIAKLLSRSLIRIAPNKDVSKAIRMLYVLMYAIEENKSETVS